MIITIVTLHINKISTTCESFRISLETIIFGIFIISLISRNNEIINYDESYDSVSSWCNNNGRDDTNIDTNISAFLPPDPPRTATYEGYRWFKITHFESLLSKEKNSDVIFPVLHQGFALPFRTDAGCCVDSCLSLDLVKFRVGFTQYVDIRIRMKHLKIPRSELMV